MKKNPSPLYTRLESQNSTASVDEKTRSLSLRGG
jgi:hypothetical protein